MNEMEQAPKAIVKKGRSLSIIWVVPIVALLIGGWLALKAWNEQGPVIAIEFETAEGLEAGKTKIKFKDVEVGLVTKIDMKDDLSGVIVTAEMEKSTEKYMRSKTQFWVVKARVAAGEVTGLGTLLSGAFIGCNPSIEGDATEHFFGLQKPPVVTADMPGRHFVLSSETLGSLDIGSPVYYRGIKVGQVVEYGFNQTADAVDIRVFIEAPYHEKVRKNTRFWNASGIDLKLDTEGVTLDTQSLITIMLGGVAFDLPKHAVQNVQAEEDHEFRLYPNKEDIEERSYVVKRYYLMYFDQNVRGLAVGAPVEIRGIEIGEIVDIKLEVDLDKATARIAVLALLEPERIDTIFDKGDRVAESSKVEIIERYTGSIVKLVDKGLRAQLKTGNLLTGQLYIDLDLYPDAEPAQVTEVNGYKVLPTLPAPFEQIAQRVNNILKVVEKLPLEEIGNDVHASIKSLNEALQAAEKLASGVDREVLPDLKSALGKFQETMSGIQQTLGPDSAINYNARNVMGEMEATIRSLRALIDYMERNPEAILFGKEEDER